MWAIGAETLEDRCPCARWCDNEVMYTLIYLLSTGRMAPGMIELRRIYFVFQALKVRSTSHVEDEPICLASLLDLDLGELLEASDEHRMEKLWSTCHQLPAVILFLLGKKKLTDESFGWAPASCMDCVDIDVPMSVPATVTPRGL